MKYFFVALALSFFLSGCKPPAPVSFADRAARAETLENTPTGAVFIGALIKEHGENINKFAGECYSTSALEKDRFTVVADIGENGAFENVDVQPATAPTRCYADKIRRLRTNASRPVGFTGKTFPIVVNVNYNK